MGQEKNETTEQYHRRCKQAERELTDLELRALAAFSILPIEVQEAFTQLLESTAEKVPAKPRKVQPAQKRKE